MIQRSIYDPRDPWAFRNTWTGEIRNSYDDLWIWATLIVGMIVVALALLIPVLIHRYCRGAGLCPNWCTVFDRCLRVCVTMDREKLKRKQQMRDRRRAEDCENALPTTITHDVRRRMEDHRRSYPAYILHHHQQLHHQPHHHHPQAYPSGYYPRSQSLPRRTYSNGRYIKRSRSSSHRRPHPHQPPPPIVPPIKIK